MGIWRPERPWGTRAGAVGCKTGTTGVVRVTNACEEWREEKVRRGARRGRLAGSGLRRMGLLSPFADQIKQLVLMNKFSAVCDDPMAMTWRWRRRRFNIPPSVETAPIAPFTMRQ